MADQREIIVKKAAELFKRYGIKSVSMDDICKELGISKKTLYAYFDQKDRLVEEMLAQERVYVQARIDESLAGNKSIWDYIEFMVRSLASAPDVRSIPPLVYDLNKYYPIIAKEHHELITEQSTMTVKHILKKGMDEGIFRAEIDVDLTAYMIAKMHSYACEEALKSGGDKMADKKMTEISMDILLRGLLSADGLKKYEGMKEK